MPPITVTSQGPPTSSALKYLAKTSSSPTPASNDTPLLQAIRTALRGSDTESVSSIHTATFFTGNEEDDQELTWNAHTVVLSYGGVMVKKWSFEEEGECIQWACFGDLEQIVSEESSSSASAANYTKNDNPSPPTAAPNANGRPTFGPFTRATIDSKPEPGQTEYAPAIYVFLRSIGRIFLLNGTDYTFSLPFIVRKAWAISPHGVMVQRVLEPTELIEAEETGDDVLPTIFSLTSPFAEAAVVGLTSGILGPIHGHPAALKDELKNSTSPLKSIPPTEMVVWTSHYNTITDTQVCVTVDVEKQQLSLWRYIYIKPRDTPVAQTRVPAPPSGISHQKRQSMGGVGSRRTSAMFDGLDRIHPMSMSPNPRTQEPLLIPDIFDLPDMPPLSSLPGMAPSLSTTMTMASLVSGTTTTSSQSQPQRPVPGHGKRRPDSLTRNELSMTMDRMALGGRMETDLTLLPIEHGRMKAAYWMENLVTHSISKEDAQSWRKITASIFDDRWDGVRTRCLLSICLPASNTMLVFSMSQQARVMQVGFETELPARSATSLRATRGNIWDLLVVKPQGQLTLLTHGMYEIPVEVEEFSDDATTDMDQSLFSEPDGHGRLVSVDEGRWGTTTLTHQDGWKSRVTFDLVPEDSLTLECFQMLALILPADIAFHLHRVFLENWSIRRWSTATNVEFECFTAALYTIFGLAVEATPVPSDPWLKLAHSKSHARFREDPALRLLRTPPTIHAPRPVQTSKPPHFLLAPLLYGLHTLGEHLRLMVNRHSDLLRFAPILCRIAFSVRPEWADYWKRLVPDAAIVWHTPLTSQQEHSDDRIPVWPPDISAILYGRISTPDWKVPWHDVQHIVSRFHITPSFEYGARDPLQKMHQLGQLFSTLSDGKVPESQKRAENVIYKMVTQNEADFVYLLPLGIAAPLREAARTCQLAPPGNWPLEAYRAIGRNDLAASATRNPDILFNDGYRSRKDFINPVKPRQTIGEIAAEARALAGGEIDAVSGVELNLKEFTDIRFGQDRRLEEVARMLCSSTVPSVKSLDRPELSEHDQTKEHQSQVVRVAERTFALPYGRAMFTFGSVPIITREAYAVPKIEYTIRVQPLNISVTPEPGKISPESMCWGEFHNGVAAGLRISPTATGVESSWIAFNKPSELSPEHAGFLLGLGLSGHLKEMLTWHTFAYLTPKHDLTSIGVLLGLSAANIGSGNQHVTKLLAVHTPALLPTPTVDLNVSLVTQAAGLSGVGLLYLGTKNRRMAEVCLAQISRKDLVQPDLSNEHREAYTYSAALAFGMIMLGKGTTIPADLGLLKRLSILIHGDASRVLGSRTGSPFDINLTSPAASIALGLMYLRTGRKDIADILTIPDTVLSLNAIQPTFLLVRTIARSLILWDAIVPSNEWLLRQIPETIRIAIDGRSKIGQPIDDAMELAYYNILAGCCFVVGLKYAGTARQEAYQLIVRHFDMFSRLAYASGPAFDHKIKRSAVRDGLNLISIALSMVMAGTGEISCLRRLRYAYGMSQQMMYHHGFKYGVHVSTHMSLGLLFLGGGRFTLGTSDAAIACMVTAFFPRFHHVSADNKSFLQALRHLWVLAVEPRCLIARDVDTNEVVYLPVKITMREGKETGVTQLISPTLIPDMDKLVSIRVDTPRYWPFYLDTAAHPRHKDALLKSQTLYVKRRTAFLSYTEDPRGSRSLFVRSGSSSGDAATLDFPQLTDAKTHPAGDLSEFITSFSNNVLFLAFADHFSRAQGETNSERLFHTYCHAALLDSILQDKPQTLQAHLTLYTYRNMSPRSRYFHLRLQDLRFAADFYAKVYERRFSGRGENKNNARPPLVRDTTVLGALHALDGMLDRVRVDPGFVDLLGRYARGDVLPETIPAPTSMTMMGTTNPMSDAGALDPETMGRFLAWYLLRNGVPVSTILSVLRGLASDAHAQCLGVPPPDGTDNALGLDMGIKEVLHSTGTRMTTALGSGWSVRSLNEIIEAWKIV
ncbi:anaphase promoting complex subunit 1 [Crassisporium funariophilum]|nr:anaphase promoting complex subunit 1 [Crassisporium funariophilum]